MLESVQFLTRFFVFRPISTGNVGRQMLEKMGWKEGEGLGREGAGRREPVSIQF